MKPTDQIYLTKIVFCCSLASIKASKVRISASLPQAVGHNLKLSSVFLHQVLDPTVINIEGKCWQRLPRMWSLETSHKGGWWWAPRAHLALVDGGLPEHSCPSRDFPLCHWLHTLSLLCSCLFKIFFWFTPLCLLLGSQAALHHFLTRSLRRRRLLGWTCFGTQAA